MLRDQAYWSQRTIVVATFFFSICALIVVPPQQILAQQVVVVILDDSGSMNESISTTEGERPRIEAAKQALINVVNGLPNDTKFGVTLLNGNETDTQLISLGPLDREQARKRIELLTADGGTPLGQAMKDAADELLAYRNQNLYGTYKMLIITDGEATDSELVSMYLPMIIARGISVDVIGVGMESDHQLASQARSYRNVNDAETFEKAITEILAESNFDQDTKEDFELIAGLPDAIAAGAIDALTQVDNSPLARSANDANTVSQSQTNSNYQIEVNGDGFLGPGCCCAPCIVLIIIIAIITNSLRKGKHRRR